MTDAKKLNQRVSAAKAATEARGETFYPGASRIHLAAFPPKERWDDWVELDSKSWPKRVEKSYMLVPTTCFNCESACGLLAYIDKSTMQVRKFDGNPEHPPSRGRNCAKGPATLNQITDPDRIYKLEDLASGDCIFAATGVTDGSLLAGVKKRRKSTGATIMTTESVVMRASSGTVRWIKGEHRISPHRG